MAFNGSGTFERLYNWVADKAADIKITASRMDGEMDGFATGLSTCITKDGQTNPTADLPMSSQKHTGVGNATARDQYAAVGQVQDSSFIYAADATNTDTYALSPSPAITAYAAGQTFIAKITNANTGATTLNVSTVGAKNVYTREGNALVGGEIPANSICVFIYDGTQFQLVSSEVDASATQKGMVELATNDEADTGTDTERAITPAALAYVLDGTGGTNLVENAALQDIADTKLVPNTGSPAAGDVAIASGGQVAYGSGVTGNQITFTVNIAGTYRVRASAYAETIGTGAATFDIVQNTTVLATSANIQSGSPFREVTTSASFSAGDSIHIELNATTGTWAIVFNASVGCDNVSFVVPRVSAGMVV